MAMMNIKIDGQPFQVEAGQTILQAAKECGYNIPTLCAFHDGKCSSGSCRVCLVEVKGARGLIASCVFPISEGMEIIISSPKAHEARRHSVEFLLSNHNRNCQECTKNNNCELLNVANLTGARDDVFAGEKIPRTLDDLTPSIVRDMSKCVLCGRCIIRCNEAQGTGILAFQNRGFKTIVGPAFNKPFDQVPCIYCGQCINVCPTGALSEKSEIGAVDLAIRQGKKVIVQTAPAVRAAIAEEFGLPIGTAGTGKMVAALRRLGFFRVFDTNFAADLTIMEEATELLTRIKTGGKLPMVTSCSPGWVNYLELFYADLIPHVSTCKSPHEMMGALIKSYFAEKNFLSPKDIFVVSIMPCTAKKYEKTRPQNANKDHLPDVDAVLTTRELAKMIKRSGMDWNKLPEEAFDQDFLGEYTGAGVIFGVTGGVMEAALRTAYFVLTGKEHDLIKFEAVRGLEGLKEASLDINGLILNVAVVSGMHNAKPILEEMKAGKSKYHFIEIMGCPGGCINGGGQPFVKPVFLPNEAADILDTYMAKRAKVLYSEDEKQVLRQSHRNTQVQALYNHYLGKPNSHLAHELLHTSYVPRVRFPK